MSMYTDLTKALHVCAGLFLLCACSATREHDAFKDHDNSKLSPTVSACWHVQDEQSTVNFSCVQLCIHVGPVCANETILM